MQVEGPAGVLRLTNTNFMRAADRVETDREPLTRLSHNFREAEPRRRYDGRST